MFNTFDLKYSIFNSLKQNTCTIVVFLYYTFANRNNSKI